jgi:hypothetical protein
MAQYPPPLNYDAGSSQFIFEDWAYSQQVTSYNTAVSLIEQSKKEILGDAPQTLDSLKEISDAINTNPSFGAETITALGQTVKLTGNQTIAGNKVFSNNVTVNGSFSNSGNTTLGDLSSNNLVVNSSVKFYNDIQFGVNGGNDDKITFWGQAQFQNKSCFRDSMLLKGENFYSEGGLYLGKYGGSGTGMFAVPTDVGATCGFKFVNISNATGLIVNEPLQIFKEGNTKFNFDMQLNGRGTFQGGAVFTDNINAYQGVIDKYITQGLYLGKFSNGRAVFACPNNGSDNGFQFCNMDSSGNILNTPFYITQQGACVVNSKLQINGNLEVVDNTTITLPTDSVAQSAVNNLTNDLGLKANDDAVVHLAGDETITGYKKFQLGGVIGDENNNVAGFEPQQNGLLYCRSGLDVVAGGNANTIAGGLQINGGLVCTDISGRNLTIAQGGVLSLPDNSIGDGWLSSNIPKKSSVNTFSNQNNFTGDIVVADCSMAFLPSSTLIMPDNFISQTKIKDINQFIKTTESNTFDNNVVLAFEGGVTNLSQIKNGYFKTIFRDPGISPPVGQDPDPTYNHTTTFTTDYDATTVNKLQNLTLKGGDLVIDAGGEFILNGAKGMTIQGGEILAINSLMKIDGIQCDKITSATKLQVNSGLNLQQDEEIIDGITIPIIRSDLTGAGVIEGQDIQATTIIFSDTINSITAAEFNYLDGATSNIQSQIDLKAPLENPALTGIPTAPTAVSTTNTEQIATTQFVKTQISELLGGAGPSIDTLLELNNVLAQADSDLSTSLTALIGTKAPISNPSFTGTVNGITKSMVGLSNVDNTSDLNKPISTAQQTALNLKADASLISNINNTSDLNKPISTATQSALNLKADASLISNINNTSDLNKPISTATQSALNLKADASLISNIDNTSDLNKPISTATQSALNLKADASLISNINNTSDADKPISTATQSALNLKADASLISNIDNTSDADKPISTATQSALNLKADALSISNINNTSDLNKPISTAQQTALNLKADASLISNIDNTSDADKPISTATQTAIDLKADASLISNIDNTSDLNKPISTATQSALDLKADTSLVSDNTNAIQELGTDIANTNNLAITNANNILLKVNTSNYDTERAVQNLNISNNAIAISNNTTAIASKLSTVTYNSDKVTLDALIASKTDTNYVDTAISNLVNGAGASIDTLFELNAVLSQADSDLSTSLTALIGTKLATSTYTANKTTTDNRLDAIESVDSQQLNLSGGTITGDFVSRQTINMMEVLNTATVSSSAVSLNYSLGSVFYITIPSATNFEVQITNCNPASSASTTNTISLIINTGTYEAFANTCKINGLTRGLTFAGGAVDITGASQVLQTISVVYSGSSSVPVAVMSSVVPFSTL